MSRIPRVTQAIFASLASNNGVFGSAQLGTKVLSNDLPTIMGLSAWEAGWLDAVLGASKFPPLEEFQALTYVQTTQLAYLFQEGIPEYDAATTYFINSIVKKTGTYQLYGSNTNDNTGNALTNATYWTLLCDLSLLGATQLFTGGASTGSANAQVVASLTPGSGFTPSNGQTVVFTAGYTNTGSATLNAGGTGALTCYKDSGSGPVVLTGGEIVATSSVFATYNSTINGYVISGGLALGTAAYKTATNNADSYVASVTSATSGNLVKANDSNGTNADSGVPVNAVPRGWANINSSGTVLDGVGVISCTNSSAGVYVINTSATLPTNISVQVTNANGSTISGSNGTYTQELSSARTTSSFTVRLVMAGILANPDQFNVSWSY